MSNARSVCTRLAIPVLLVFRAPSPPAIAQSIQPIYLFPKSSAGPWAGLLPLPNGWIYGTTEKIGSNSDGTVFAVTTNGGFTNAITGEYPQIFYRVYIVQ